MIASTTDTIEEQLLSQCGSAALHVQLKNPELVNKWASYACRGDKLRLRELLLRRGVDLEKSPRELARDRSLTAENSSIPHHLVQQEPCHWALEFQDPVNHSTTDFCVSSSTEKTHVELPHLQLWRPHAEHAWQLLANKLGSASWCEQIILDAKSNLIGQLAQISEKALNREYLVQCPRFDESSWESLLSKFPILNRLIVTTCDQWAVNTFLLLQRWLQDREEIQQCFFPSEEEQVALKSAKFDLGDPHNGGQRTCLLILSRGLKLIYKPRNTDIELGWDNCLAWLQSNGLDHSINSPKILPAQKIRNGNAVNSDYGWFEYLQFEGSSAQIDSAELSDNCGVLTALAWLFSLNDLHQSNLIMDGHSLVPIDVETLLQPLPPKENEQHATAPTFQKLRRELRDSVLYTGMLPRWAHDFENQIVDMSGLGLLDSLDRSDFLKGFRRASDYFLNKLEMILSESGPLQFFQQASSRVLFRSTGVYELLKRNSLEAENLCTGTAWSLPWEALHRYNYQQVYAAIIRAEKIALSELDIPMFHARTNERHLYVNNQKLVSNYFEQSGIDLVRNRLASLSKREIDNQEHLCELSLLAREESLDPVSATTARNIHCAEPSRTEPLLMETCRTLGEQLEESAHIYGESAAWHGITTVSDGKHFQVDGLELGLYNGNLGICLYLSELDRIRGEQRHQLLIEKALFPLQEFLSDSVLKKQFSGSAGIGAASGIGGILYVLSRLLQFQQQLPIYEWGNSLVSLCSDELIERDRQYDIMGGCAGAIMGLLAWYSKTKQKQALDKAIQCAEKLVGAQHKSGCVEGAWPGSLAPALCGMSHGNAGIVLSLLKLQKYSPSPRTQLTIQRALEFESSIFDADVQNWPDLRHNTACNREPSQWCHGAAGIGLARLGCLEFVDTPQIRADINNAIDNVIAQDLKPVDYLCCGNIGAIELLLQAGIKTQQESLIMNAQERIARVHDRAINHGSFAFDLGRDIDNPGFFLGTAGIGYSMLRMIDPKLPCALLFE